MPRKEIRKDLKSIIPAEIIQSQILLIRNKKVMLDSDLASLYGIEVKYLTRQVQRNEARFPCDFIRLRRRPRALARG